MLSVHTVAAFSFPAHCPLSDGALDTWVPPICGIQHAGWCDALPPPSLVACHTKSWTPLRLNLLIHSIYGYPCLHCKVPVGVNWGCLDKNSQSERDPSWYSATLSKDLSSHLCWPSAVSYAMVSSLHSQHPWSTLSLYLPRGWGPTVPQYPKSDQPAFHTVIIGIMIIGVVSFVLCRASVTGKWLPLSSYMHMCAETLIYTQAQAHMQRKRLGWELGDSLKIMLTKPLPVQVWRMWGREEMAVA